MLAISWLGDASESKSRAKSPGPVLPEVYYGSAFLITNQTLAARAWVRLGPR